MTIYCPDCSKFIPMEMEEISHNLLRCPQCLRTRRVNIRLFGPADIEDISPGEARQELDRSASTAKTIAVVGAIAIGAALLLGGSKKNP